MKVGIGSYAFRYAIGDPTLPPAERMNLARLLEYSHLERIPVVQVCDNLPLHRMSGADLQEARDLAQQYGIELEIGTIGYSSEHLTRYVEIARLLRAKVLRAVLGGGCVDGGADDVLRQIRRLVPALEANQTTLAIENHFDLPPPDLHRLIVDLDHPLVGICMDPLNSISHLWGVQETIGCLQEHIVSAHVKDVTVRRKGAGFLITGCPLGEGDADIPTYLRQVHAANPECNLFLEQWMDPGESLAQTLAAERKWVADGMAFLNRIVSSL
jgi:sugar phosphate isomerase/epimerase